MTNPFAHLVERLADVLHKLRKHTLDDCYRLGFNSRLVRVRWRGRLAFRRVYSGACARRALREWRQDPRNHYDPTGSEEYQSLRARGLAGPQTESSAETTARVGRPNDSADALAMAFYVQKLPEPDGCYWSCGVYHPDGRVCRMS